MAVAEAGVEVEAGVAEAGVAEAEAAGVAVSEAEEVAAVAGS